jgi:tripartite-type tricarboxylate transporter receptor subunit TctC
MDARFTRRQLLGAGAAGTLASIGMPALAQPAWPNKPVRVIAGYPAGGQTDLFARSYGEYISQQTGQPWLVENRPGAGGSIAAGELKRAAPDGYTLMFTISTTVIMNRVLYKSLPYDTDRDFVIVSIMPAGSLPTVAATKTGATNLKEFVAYAKKAGKVNIGTYAAGSYAHMVVAELNKEYGLNAEAVHYKGEAPMWTDLGGGTIDAATGSYGAALPILQSGRGRAIAVSRKRIGKMPDVGTFSEQGATSRAYQLTGFQCCVAPIGTPQPVLRRLSELLVAGGRSERVQAMLQQFGVDESAMDFEATQKLYADEAPLWVELVKNLGLTPL